MVENEVSVSPWLGRLEKGLKCLFLSLGNRLWILHVRPSNRSEDFKFKEREPTSPKLGFTGRLLSISTLSTIAVGSCMHWDSFAMIAVYPRSGALSSSPAERCQLILDKSLSQIAIARSIASRSSTIDGSHKDQFDNARALLAVQCRPRFLKMRGYYSLADQPLHTFMG